MSTVDELLQEGARRLGQTSSSARLDADLLLSHVLGRSREQLYCEFFSPVSVQAQAHYAALIKARENHQPIAHLVGKRDFWSFTLKVTQDTLVPRPESELLVELALAKIPPEGIWSVGDLGTGTGALALAIARERPACKILASDLSTTALKVARENRRALQLPNLRFRHSNWFDQWAKTPRRRSRYHLLVANPPYIRTDEWASADPELAFEPRLALDGGPDGLDAYRILAAGAPPHLHPGGWLMLEHGFQQGPEVRSLLRAAGFSQLLTTPDLAGRPRVTAGRCDKGPP